MEKVITNVEINSDIIQVKLMNVEKNSLFVSNIFEIVSNCNINIDMISQVMLEDEMRIDFTVSSEDQKALNKAIDLIKEKHPRILVYQSKNVGKLMVEGKGMKDAIGVASKVFGILGSKSIPLYQVTTSDISISYVIDKEYLQEASMLIKKEYNL